MRIGIGAMDITPEVGARIACFPRRPDREPRRATAVRDPLLARAVVFESGGEVVAICSCDVTLLRSATVRRIRQLVGRIVPALDGPRLVLAATHTHAGPETTRLFGNELDADYMAFFEERVALAVITAWQAREEGTLALGRATTAITHNRRVRGERGATTMAHEFDATRTHGPVDPELLALRIDIGGRPRGVLWNLAAHALTLGGANDAFSADWPGHANRVIERDLPVARALFVNGGAGNIHPRQCMRGDDTALIAMGDAAGAAVVEAAAAATTLTGEPFGFAHTRATFPNRMDESLTVSVELSCIRLGELVIGTMPGEPFVELQQRFKKAVAPAHGLFVGYVNDWAGYVPPRQAYREGGYGVTKYVDDPPQLSRTCLPRGAGERLVEALIAMARDLRR